MYIHVCVCVCVRARVCLLCTCVVCRLLAAALLGGSAAAGESTKHRGRAGEGCMSQNGFVCLCVSECVCARAHARARSERGSVSEVKRMFRSGGCDEKRMLGLGLRA
jgi:hypothetical protein